MSDEFSYEEQDGVLIGRERYPLNAARHFTDSIHDDNTAKELGFRGGTIAGSLHMEQFPPLLLAAFGEAWASSGGISLYFTKATVEGEAIKTFVAKPAAGAAQARAWMEDVQGEMIAEGTANIGGADAQSELRQRMQSIPPAENLRMLSSVKIGQPTPRIRSSVPASALEDRLQLITESLPAYTEEGSQGGRALTPALQVHLLSQAAAGLVANPADLGIGLYGAIEIQQYGTPALVDREYEVQATALAVGETPKTEYIYYESKLFVPGDDQCILSMIMMNRFMKKTSRLWQ